MSALAIEAPRLPLAPVGPPRRRERQVRGPKAAPRAAVRPVTGRRVGELADNRRAQAVACVAPAVGQWELTSRGIAVVTASTMLVTLSGLVTVVAQFLSIPA